MARLVHDTESSLPNRHLIANNGHGTPHLSILNAHYDRDCSFIRKNYRRNTASGYDETGFDGANDYPYRLAVRNITDRASPANTIAADNGMDFQCDGWSFYRAVNLGGGAVTIDGNRWDAGGAQGVSFAGSSFDDPSVALHPPTDASRAAMVHSSVWNSRGSNVTLKDLPAGRYKVYLYVWEDNVSQTFDISINGSGVRQAYISGAAGHWERLGPWKVDVTNGTILLQCSPGDANLSGIEVWRLSSHPRSEGRALPAVPASQTSRWNQRADDPMIRLQKTPHPWQAVWPPWRPPAPPQEDRCPSWSSLCGPAEPWPPPCPAWIVSVTLWKNAIECAVDRIVFWRSHLKRCHDS